MSNNNDDDDGGGGGGYRSNSGHGHDRSSRRESGPHESDYSAKPVKEIPVDYDKAAHEYYEVPRQALQMNKLIQRARRRRLQEATSRIKELEHELEETQDDYQRLETSFRLYLEKSEANNVFSDWSISSFSRFDTMD